MKCNYIAKIENNSPVWPPTVDEKGGAQYFYPEGLGVCSAIGQIPNTSTMLGQIDTSPANHVKIQADGRWEYIETIEEVTVGK